MRLLKDRGCDEPIDEIDKSSNAWKMYKDFVVPPLPQAYAHLNLPTHWLIYMFVKKDKPRSHKKQTQGFMNFNDLAKAIGDSYKEIDDDTKAWLDEVSTKLMAYNKQMRADLAEFLRAHGRLDEAEERMFAGFVGRSAPAVEASENSESSNIPQDSLPVSDSPNGIFEKIRRRQRLLSLESARLSHQMQQLQTMRRQNEMMMIHGSRRETVDRYGLSPFASQFLSPYQVASHLALGGLMGSRSLPFTSRMPRQNLRERLSNTETQSLLCAESSPKRKNEEDDNAQRKKRSKTETQVKAKDETRARAASLEEIASFIRPPLTSHRTQASSGPTSLASSHPALLAAKKCSGTSNYDRLMLDFRLRMNAPSGMTANEIASRLNDMDRQVLPSPSGIGARLDALHSRGSTFHRNDQVDDEVAAGLKALKRRVASAAGGVPSRMPRRFSDEMTASLSSDNHGNVVDDDDDDEVAAAFEALKRRVARVGGANACAGSKFGLSLTDIEGILKRNK